MPGPHCAGGIFRKATERGGVARRVQNGPGGEAAGAMCLAAAVTGPFSAGKTTEHCAAVANSKMVGGRGLMGRNPPMSLREFCCVTMFVVSPPF